MDVKATAIDLLSLTAHKLHGPKGVGALYVKKGLRFHPSLRGGKQERGRRAGTENVPGIVGFGKAAELAMQGFEDEHRVRALRDRLEAGLLERIPRSRVNGAVSTRLGNTSNISFERVDGEAAVELLSRLGIAVASGAACASGLNEASHVLRAMRVPLAMAMGAIRFSLSKDNSDGEIDRVLEVLPRLIESLRKPRPTESSQGFSSQYGSQPA
jgi:cysteine desulfurase